MSEKTINRLRRKLEQRDRRIAGLERHIAYLESALAKRTGDAVLVDSSHLRRDLERSVTEALCNVRLIPIHGIGKNSRIDADTLATAIREAA